MPAFLDEQVPSFGSKLTAKWNEGKFVCVGLDKGEFEFDKSIIEATSPFVCAYKLNSAFYEAGGEQGWKNLEQTISYLKQNHPDIVIVLDAKRGDISNTNEAYVKAFFDELSIDAVTVHPYLGKESLLPFLERVDKGIFVLAKTSNEGAAEFQDLKVDGIPLYQVVAQHVNDWNKNKNCGVVVGATYSDELKKVREIVGDMPILVPGIGAQGGSLEETIKNGLDSNKQGLIISSSRAIINDPDPKSATQKLHNEITGILKTLSF